MAAKKPGKKPRKKKASVGECPNPGRAYTLWELVAQLKNKEFARFFFDLLKLAEGNNRDAIECVNSYLEPTVEELQELGIPESQIDRMRRCTDSGLLVLVSAAPPNS